MKYWSVISVILCALTLSPFTWAGTPSNQAPQVFYGCWSRCLSYDSDTGLWTDLGPVISKSGSDVLDAYQKLENSCRDLADDGCGAPPTELAVSVSEDGVRYSNPFDRRVCRSLSSLEAETWGAAQVAKRKVKTYCGPGTPLG